KESCKRTRQVGITRYALKMGTEFAKRGKDDQLSGAGHDRFVLHVPGVRVRNVNGIETDLHRGIDVAARAVADHPTLSFNDFVFVHQSAVGDSIFFWNDFNGFKKSLQSGAL